MVRSHTESESVCMLKCVSEGKICARSGPGVVRFRKVRSIVNFRIGVAERVNTLKSKLTIPYQPNLSSVTSLTGRPGTRCGSQEVEGVVIRVRLGRLDSSNGHESLGAE